MGCSTSWLVASVFVGAGGVCTGPALVKVEAHVCWGGGILRFRGGERAGIREVISVATRSAAGLREARECV